MVWWPQPGDDVMEPCGGREKVEGRVPLEQRAMVDFLTSMFDKSSGSFWNRKAEQNSYGNRGNLVMVLFLYRARIQSLTSGTLS